MKKIKNLIITALVVIIVVMSLKYQILDNTQAEVTAPGTTIQQPSTTTKQPVVAQTEQPVANKNAPALTHNASLPAYSKDYIKNRDVRKDFEDAQVMAKKEGKNILLIAGGNWCPWCNALDRFFKLNPEVTKYLFKNFVVLKVYIDRGFRINQDFLTKFASTPSTPHFYLFKKDGTFVKNFDTTPLETGGGPQNGYGKDAVLKLLKEWRDI